MEQKYGIHQIIVYRMTINPSLVIHIKYENMKVRYVYISFHNSIIDSSPNMGIISVSSK